jgi:hypothetical protein
MEFEIIEIEGTRIAEAVSGFVSSADEAVDLLGNLYYQEADRVILYEKNMVAGFFDLKTGIAGDVLQKFSNYRVKLAIVGDFDAYKSKSLKDFILESNKLGQVNFVASREEAIDKLQKTMKSIQLL